MCTHAQYYSMDPEKEKIDQTIDDIRDDPEYQSEVERIASLMKQKGVLERNAPEKDQKKFMFIFFCCFAAAMVILVLRLFKIIPLFAADCVFGGLLVVCLIIMGIRRKQIKF